MKHFFMLLAITFMLVSCKNDTKSKSETHQQTSKKQQKPMLKSNAKGIAIIKDVVEKVGGKKYETATVTYNFRGDTYQIERNCGEFEFKRTAKTEKGQTVVNQLNNAGFKQFIDKREQTLADSTASSLENTLNSINYFVEIPFGLNAKAVHKKYLGEESIDGKDYTKIKVAFAEEGGGEDYQDEYMYWIDPKENTISYLAYSFQNNGGGGLRLRKAYNPRTVNGIRFVDYENYAPKKGVSIKLENLVKALQNDKLKKVSDIEISNISVKIRDRNCG